MAKHSNPTYYCDVCEHKVEPEFMRLVMGHYGLNTQKSGWCDWKQVAEGNYAHVCITCTETKTFHSIMQTLCVQGGDEDDELEPF